MRAIQVQEFGGPEVLRIADVARPEPGPGEVLIQVTRAGINFADTHQRRNEYLAKAELPLVPGTEVAGVRDDTGERVVAVTGTGGYAEYAAAPEALTVPIPDGVDDATALALIVQGLTAWHLYRTSARIREGETVVVHAGAGGVGSLAVQLGRPMGAGRVIATASSEEKRALALELGADAAVDSAPEGVARRRRGRLCARGARRPPRRREPRQARRRRLRDGGRRGVRAVAARAGAVRAARGVRRRVGRAQRGADGAAHAPLGGGRRVLAHALHGPAGEGGRAARRPLRARRARRAAGDRRRDLPAERGGAGARGHA